MNIPSSLVEKNSPTCAIMQVNKLYDAMLKGTPKPISQERWYIKHDLRILPGMDVNVNADQG